LLASGGSIVVTGSLADSGRCARAGGVAVDGSGLALGVSEWLSGGFGGLDTIWLRLGHGVGGGWGMRDAQARGGGAELREHAPPERLEAPTLGRREVGWQAEAGELVQGGAEPLELGLERARPHRERRAGCAGWPEQSERLAQQLAAVVLVGRTPGVHQGERVARPQPMAGNGVDQAVLLLVPQTAELVAERRPYGPAAELLRGVTRQLAAERQASLDPLALVAEQPTNGARTEPVLSSERADHARLVECRRGARGGIGQEQPALVLRARARGRHQHRPEAVAALAPASEALEAVQDLVVAILTRRDQEGILRTRLAVASRHARSQRRVAAVQPLQSHQQHRPGNLLGLARRAGSPRRACWLSSRAASHRLGRGQHALPSSAALAR
jgi:hypothetical protein